MAMIDKYGITLAVREAVKANGYTAHPRSFVHNTVKMGELIDAVAAKMEVQGFREADVKEAMVTQAKHLCAAWRGLEENSNFIVDKYVSSGHTPDDAHNEHQTEDNDTPEPAPTPGPGPEPEPGEPIHGEVQETDEEVEHNNGGGGFGIPDPVPNPDPVPPVPPTPGPEPVPPVPPVPPIDDVDKPVSDDYEPPSIWFKCCRIIRWNLAHPGEAKNIMLVGPKGIGKTKMVFELSKKFFQKRPYAVTAPQMEFKISGFKDAFGREVSTPITKGYVDVDGAIILIDEIDRMDAGAGIALNMGTANKAMDTPNGMIEQSDKVTFIATANTSGTGATNDYNTANQLDASTRDRWIYLLMEWDHNVALKVARGDATLVKGLEDWNTACDKMQYTSGQLSYRTIIDILDLMDMGCFTFEECIESAMLKYAIPKSNLQAIYNLMEDHYNKVAKAIKVIMDKMPDNDNLF